MTSSATLKAATTIREETTMPNNPFPGLRPFKQKETHLFFGREGQSKELLKRLQDSRFLALVGVSGSGKSSLIRAGLLPKLDGGLMAAVDSDWRVAVFRPGDNPIRNMARALVVDAGLGGDSGLQDVEVAIAETTLRRGNLGLLELLKQAKRKVRDDGKPFLAPNENVLVVVDQFEEIFRIIEQYDELVRVKQLSAGNSDPAVAGDLNNHPREEASAFVKLLLESTKKNGDGKYDENVYVIVTMRSDYLGDTAQFGGMPERINDGQYLIPRMDRDDRRKAIVGPVAVAGGAITEPLVNQLLNDAGEDPGRLPILQHALMRMWDVAERASQNGGLNLEHYERIEKLSGALSQHANEAFDELSKDHQTLAAKIFKCLTEKGLANRETRRPMKIADICEVVGAKEEDVKTVVDCFRKNGRWFLMPPEHEKPQLASDTLIDISHESLISGWDKLRAWVNEEAESAGTYKRLADTAILKELGKEDFYRGPALQLALKWRDDNAPNPAWARRYHPEYSKANSFLNDSLKDTQKREKAEKDRAARELRRTRIYNMILGILAVMFLLLGGFAVGLQRRISNNEVAQAKERENNAARERLQAIDREQEARKLQGEAVEARQVAEALNKKLNASLQTERAAVAAAQRAEAVAIERRNTAIRLQHENAEQATTYRYFKTAFDYVAAREYDKALTSLQSALTYFEGKEGDAPNDSDRKQIRTNRISTMVNIADVHRSKGDPDNNTLAIEKYNEAIKMLGPGDDELLAPTLMKAGSVWKNSPDQDKSVQAVAYYERAANVYTRINNEADSSRAWVEAGKIHLRFNDDIGRRRALHDFSKAVSLLDGNDRQLAATSAEIGEAYVRLIAGEDAFEEEDDESPPSGNAKNLEEKVVQQLRQEGARFFGKASNAYENVKEFKNAADKERKAGEILTGGDSPDLLQAASAAFVSASTLYGRASNFAEQATVLMDGAEALLAKEHEAAKGLADTLLEQAAVVDQKNVAEQTQTLYNIGEIYAELSPPDRDRALEYHQQAILFARRHNDKASELGAIMAKVGTVEELDGENGLAQLNDLYDQAVQIYKDDPVRNVGTIVRFGKAVMGTSREEARTGRAKQFFDRALGLASTQPGKQLLAQTYLDVGLAYGVQRRQQASDYYHAGLTIYEAEGDLFGQAMALYRLGMLPGTGATQFVDRSLALFARVLPAVETSGKQFELAEAYFALGSLNRRKREFQTALNYYNRALEIYQKLPDQKTRLNTVKNVIRTTQRQLPADRESSLPR
jgi:hypothetical protein